MCKTEKSGFFAIPTSLQQKNYFYRHIDIEKKGRSCHAGANTNTMAEAMKWTQVKVNCKPADLDTVCAVVSMIDTHMMIEDFSDVIECNPVYGELIDEALLARRDEAAVSIYLSQEEKNIPQIVEGLRAQLDTALSQNGRDPALAQIELIGLDEEDWADNWKQYYKPIKIGRRLVIVPEWEHYTPADGEITVTMDPGMAFGTGTHETTQLCAALLEEYMPAGAAVLDVGTGSGILAICAEKLGAASVDAYDIDPMAVKVAVENAEHNGCRGIRCAQSDLLAAVSGVYDFVCANIVADIIVRMAPDVARYMKHGALLAASGVIDSQEKRVIDALTAGGLTLIDTLHNNDWCGLLFKKA